MAIRRLFWRWVIFTVSLFLAARVTSAFVDGFHVDDIETVGQGLRLMAGAAALALINATLGTVLRILTLPLTCLTLGLFSLVVNAGVLMAAGSLELGFRVDGFVPALIGAVLLAVINSILGTVIPDDKEKD
ncbi:MAG: phage holin family protein [Armatimonadetes bacterium]|nr:phage holin family protein [Armatimonadota bacterium]